MNKKRANLLRSRHTLFNLLIIILIKAGKPILPKGLAEKLSCTVCFDIVY